MLQRSSTFLVGTRQQRVNLAEFGKDEKESVEASDWTKRSKKHVPLCFSSESFQQTHPAKVKLGSVDADACLTSPMLVGVLDGVSQLEEFGYDPSELPRDLCRACEELAYQQLMPEVEQLGSRPREMYFCTSLPRLVMGMRMNVYVYVAAFLSMCGTYISLGIL
eukprot:g527.t1